MEESNQPVEEKGVILEQSSHPIILDLQEKFPVIQWFYEESYGMVSIHVPKDHILEVMEYLKNDQKHAYSFLTDLCGIHVTADPGKELGVIYHLHNATQN